MTNPGRYFSAAAIGVHGHAGTGEYPFSASMAVTIATTPDSVSAISAVFTPRLMSVSM